MAEGMAILQFRDNRKSFLKVLFVNCLTNQYAELSKDTHCCHISGLSIVTKINIHYRMFYRFCYRASYGHI